MERKAIEIRKFERQLYLTHIAEGDNRFAHALTILFLRRDFYSFLKEYSVAISGNSNGIIRRPKLKEGQTQIPEYIFWKKGEPILDGYLKKIEKCSYVSSMNGFKRKDIVEMLRNLLVFYYPYIVFGRKWNEDSVLLYDSSLNSSRTFFKVTYLDDFNQYFPKQLMLGSTPAVGDMESHVMKKIRPNEDERPRMLMIFCDELVGKDELIKYIDKHWGEMGTYLKRYDRKSTREKAWKTFLRDVDIYNMYAESDKKSSLEKELYVEKQMGFEESEDISDGFVRKTVSRMEKFLKSVNY